MRILSGIQPSGKLHLGNYFGMMKPALDLQARGETFYFIADLHALTTVSDPAQLRANSRDVALDFLACGLDPDKTVFFRQSAVPEVCELTWYLSCVTTLGLLERCHSYKDKIDKGITPTHALFAYPVLMAADILLYQAHQVPVGKDQKQHLEVTRDLAIRFNAAFGEVFTVPEPFIQAAVAVVPGLDGQKMSKSYGNTIELFGEEKAVRKRIQSIVTDSTPLEAPKDPDRCTVFALYSLFADAAERQALADRYRAGGMGYGEAKKALFEIFWERFAPYRKRRAELAADPGYVEAVLTRGAARARLEARRTLDQVRRLTGVEPMRP
ncbi:MAG: tryptophan--tRNA ligase [Lentisphaerae bacterium]|nr:tryptophan--tRNA ligase [Lentisphaerota bacterium]